MNNTRNAVCICLIALSLLGKTFSSESSQNFNLKEIAEVKWEDLNASDIESAVRMIEGTAKSMGLIVKG